MASAVASGRLKIKDFAENPSQYLRIEWRPDAWEWVQPREDFETAKGMVRAGFRSREDVVTELGGDIEVIDRRNAELNAQTDELGLVYDSDARKVSESGQAGSVTEEEEDPEDQEETAEETQDEESNPFKRREAQ